MNARLQPGSSGDVFGQGPTSPPSTGNQPADGEVQRLPLTPPMKQAVDEVWEHQSTLALTISVVSGMAAVWCITMLVQTMVAYPITRDASSALGLIVVGLVALLVFRLGARVWWKLRTVYKTSESYRSYVRSTGTVTLYAPPTRAKRRAACFIRTPAGETYPMKKEEFNALVKLAKPGPLYVSENPMTWNNPEPTVWTLENATILYHRRTRLVFGIHGPDERVLYRDRRIPPPESVSHLPPMTASGTLSPGTAPVPSALPAPSAEPTPSGLPVSKPDGVPTSPRQGHSAGRSRP